MEDRSGRLWGVAAASGLASFLILWLAAGYGGFAALLLALLILALVALVLWILWDEDDEDEESLNPFRPAPASAFDAADDPDSEPFAPMAAAPPPAAASGRTAPAARAAPAHKTPASAHKSPQRGDPRTAPRRGTPPPAKAAPHHPDPAGSRADAPGQVPPPATGLQRIRGIGPRLEARLAALGVAALADLAALDGDGVARVEAALGTPGRMAREGWQAQARALLAAGEDE